MVTGFDAVEKLLEEKWNIIFYMLIKNSFFKNDFFYYNEIINVLMLRFSKTDIWSS